MRKIICPGCGAALEHLSERASLLQHPDGDPHCYYRHDVDFPKNFERRFANYWENHPDAYPQTQGDPDHG